MLKNHSFVILLIIFLSETHPPHTKPLSWLQSLCESHRESIYNYKMCTAPFTWNFELCRRTRPIYSTWNVCKRSISNFRPGLTSPQKVTIDCIVNGVKQSSVGLKYAMWGLSSSMGGGGDRVVTTSCFEFLYPVLPLPVPFSSLCLPTPALHCVSLVIM